MEQNNHTLWYKLRFSLCFIFNQLPFFHVSQDERFDSIANLTDLRFSLIALPFGDKHLYIASFCKISGFEWGKCLRLSNIQPPLQLSELNEKVHNFSELSAAGSESDSQLRIEFLKHKHEECKNGINVLNNKVNSYIAIALVYAGLFAFLLQSSPEYVNLPAKYLTWFFFILSGINLVNVLVLLPHYLQVKGSHKSTFGSFKNEPSLKLLAQSLYMDWQTASHEKTAAATIVVNIEKYFIRSIILCALLFVVIEVSPVFFHKEANPNGTAKVSNEFVLLNQGGDFSPQALLKLSQNISPKNKITFIYSISNIDGNATAKFIINALKLAKQSSFVVISDEHIKGRSLIAVIQEKK